LISNQRRYPGQKRCERKHGEDEQGELGNEEISKYLPVSCDYWELRVSVVSWGGVWVYEVQVK
jgi:hypothetical protein